MARARSLLFRSPQLDKQLLALSQANNRAAGAARCAEWIIHDFLETGGGIAVARKLTHHGELRIKKCLKFDLGGGYRLIAQKREQGICFLYAGHHDACDRWLERRRLVDFSLKRDMLGNIELRSEIEDEAVVEEMPDDGSEEYEKQLLELLDEKVLRAVFSGICGGRKTSS